MKTVLLSTAATLLVTAAFADVETRPFTFKNEGAALSGTLYLPESYNGTALPADLVTGSWTSVEEQLPSPYARAMAERGFAAVTSDFRGWGKSGNLPADTVGGMRFIEDPEAKVSDIRAALIAMAALPEADAAQINDMGIRASAGQMAGAASGNAGIARVGVMAPWLQNRGILEAVYGGSEGIAHLMQLAAGAEAAGCQAIHAAYAEESLMQDVDYYSNFDRGLNAAYDNKWNTAGWNDWLTYTPANRAGQLDEPLAVVHAQTAAIPQGVDAFLAGCQAHATITRIDDVTQFDFYDQYAAVEKAADAMALHFAPHDN